MEQIVPSEQLLKFLQLDPILPLEKMFNVSARYEKTHEAFTWTYNIYNLWKK